MFGWIFGLFRRREPLRDTDFAAVTKFVLQVGNFSVAKTEIIKLAQCEAFEYVIKHCGSSPDHALRLIERVEDEIEGGNPFLKGHTCVTKPSRLRRFFPSID